MEDTVKTERTSRPVLGQALMFAGLSILGGGSAAGVMIGMRDSVSAILFTVAGGLVLLGAVLVFVAIKVGDFDPPTFKTRTGRAQMVMLVCAILGMIVGFYINVSGATDRIIDGDFSLSQTEAIVGLAILSLVVLPISVFWQRQIDEHESAAAKDAAYLTLNIYMYGYMAMALAASAGMIPWIGGGTIFLAVMVTFLIIWTGKRFA